MPQGNYDFDRGDFGLLLIRKAFPERTDGESAVIRAFLLEHLTEFDRITFGKRVGRGELPDPAHLPAIQQQTLLNTQKRIDLLAYRGRQPIVIEVKQRVTPAALGQILTYRLHLLEEMPDAPEPELVVVGRESDADTIRALTGHGVTVYLYPEAVAPDHAARGRV